jgi:MFS family permease
MTGFHETAPAAIACAFGFGIILGILCSLKPFLSEKMEIPEERVGSWISAAQMAIIPFTFLSGLMADYWGARGALVAGSLLAGLAFFGLSLSRDVWTTWLSLGVTAAGAAALSVGAIVLMPGAFLGNNGASASLGLLFVPLAALTAGGLTPVILGQLALRRALSVLAIFCLVPAFAVTMTPSEAFPQAAGPGDLSKVLGDPFLWLISLAFLLYIPLEGALGSWASTYLMQMGFSERRVAVLVNGFWWTFIGSRVGAAFLEYRYVRDAEPWIIITLAFLGAVAVGGLAGTHHRAHAIFWLLLVALAMGAIFPNLVGILYRHFHEGEIGTAYGASFMLGSAGSLLLPPVLSTYARRTSLRTAFRLPILLCLLLAGGGLALALAK